VSVAELTCHLQGIFCDKILSKNLQAVAYQGYHLEGSSSYKRTAYREVYCTLNLFPIRPWPSLISVAFAPNKASDEGPFCCNLLSYILGVTNTLVVVLMMMTRQMGNMANSPQQPDTAVCIRSLSICSTACMTTLDRRTLQDQLLEVKIRTDKVLDWRTLNNNSNELLIVGRSSFCSLLLIRSHQLVIMNVECQPQGGTP
jgi:hypothetical protein